MTQLIDTTDVHYIARNAKAWPFVEAMKILERINNKTPEKGYVLFETGYGASGLPHIGTFSEVFRTTMVRQAFQAISDIPTKLYCVSDDMDALRKVPDNVPNKDMLRTHLGKPLTDIPDPFEKYESFGAHNNARLHEFLNAFNFDFTFISATKAYKSGVFDETIKKIAGHFDEIMAIMLPTLGAERQQTYCPFLPICPTSGVVLQVRAEKIDINNYTMTYIDPQTQQVVTVPLTGGHCKLQWKIDWPMRWLAFGVDYEMYGKDLIDSITVGHKISKVIGNVPPEGFNYEHFLDDKGEKISKSKGNGISIEDWLSFAPKESLAYYMFQTPKRAKKLYFDVIPKAVDEYLTMLEKFENQALAERLENPVWHLHSGHPPKPNVSHINFNILLNLASIANAESKETLWRFVNQYDKNATPESMPLLDKLIESAYLYAKNFIKRNYRAPNDTERAALNELVSYLKSVDHADAYELQQNVFEIGKKYPFETLRDWFKAIYEVVLGQTEGPRMGSFIALYGVDATIALIEQRLS